MPLSGDRQLADVKTTSLIRGAWLRHCEGGQCPRFVVGVSVCRMAMATLIAGYGRRIGLEERRFALGQLRACKPFGALYSRLAVRYHKRGD
jgi:hypothetical protein